MSQLGDRFQSLERQFDLPTHAVQLKYLSCRPDGTSCEHQYVFRELQCHWPRAHLLFARPTVPSADEPGESPVHSFARRKRALKGTSVVRAEQPAIALS